MLSREGMRNVRPEKVGFPDCHEHCSSTFVLGHLEKEANVSNSPISITRNKYKILEENLKELAKYSSPFTPLYGRVLNPKGKDKNNSILYKGILPNFGSITPTSGRTWYISIFFIVPSHDSTK